jgi:hypothetical protein
LLSRDCTLVYILHVCVCVCVCVHMEPRLYFSRDFYEYMYVCEYVMYLCSRCLGSQSVCTYMLVCNWLKIGFHQMPTTVMGTTIISSFAQKKKYILSLVTRFYKAKHAMRKKNAQQTLCPPLRKCRRENIWANKLSCKHYPDANINLMHNMICMYRPY